MKKILLCALFVLADAACFRAMGQSRADKYTGMGATWLSDRLQMHWNTHATRQYMSGEAYSHCGGERSPVPTLQINGARSHVTIYRRPSLDELPARHEDSRGMFLRNNSLPGQPYEWAAISHTGNIIGSINNEIAAIALDAARQYSACGDKAYADAAANVLITYMLGVLHTHMPVDMNHGHMQTLYGLQTQEVIHEDVLPRMCDLYSLLGDYLRANGSIMADSLPQGALGGHASLPDAIEAAFKHWADIIEANGVPHNNWNLMQARFIFNVATILRPDSAYADGKGREHYLRIVETGKSIRQWSLKTLTEYGYDPATAIWCECPGYSQVVLGDLASFVALYRERLGLDLMERLPIIGRAARANVEYLFPDSMTIGFGDTHPSRLNKGVYDIFGIDMATLHPSRTFAAPKTSWLIQRTGMDKHRSMAFALNASQGNHMHANGISLELYARGLRLAPDGGIGYALYSGDDYKEYYSQFPAHNTVCVDGVSSYPVMMSCHPFTIVANEQPRLLGDTMQYQYSTVRFTEPETQSEQQRTVVMVSNTADDGDGYFVDIFRSRRADGNDRFHDYFYHNMGQTMSVETSDGTPIALQPTEEPAFAGGHLYAYSYLYDKQSVATPDDAMITYSVNGDSIVMRQWVKGETGRTLFKALSPSTEGLSRMSDMPYDIRRTPTLTFMARQQGEAWTRPFVCIFQASTAADKGTIARVDYPEVKVLDKAGTSAVALLVTHTDGRRELVVSADNDNAKVRVMGKTCRGRMNIYTM